VIVGVALASLTLTGCIGPAGRETGVSVGADGRPIAFYADCGTGIKDVTLRTASGEVLWQVTSDGLPGLESLPVGSEPPGFTTVVPYKGNPAPGDGLRLGINDPTDRYSNWQPQFKLSSLQPDRIVDGQMHYETLDRFRSVGRSICNGTYGDPPEAVWIVLGGGMLLLVALVCGFGVWAILRRRQKPGLRPPPPPRYVG